MARKQAGPITLFFMGIIFTAIGGGVTYFKTWPDYKLAKASMNWPSTTGTILKSKVRKERKRSDGKTKTYYHADISFSYYVNDKPYESNQIYIGSNGFSSTSSSSAYDLVAKYKVNDEVKVFYSKEKSHQGVLEPGVNKTVYIFLGVGLLFALVGLPMFVLGLFKFAVFATMAGVFLSSLFGKKDKSENKPKTPGPTKFKKTPKNTPSNNTVDNELGEIDLSDEMGHFNKVASTSLDPCEEPWKYSWTIKGKDKNYGPYSYEKILEYYEKGKIKGGHDCISPDGSLVKIASIIDKKKAS